MSDAERIEKLATAVSFLLDLHAHKETCDYIRSVGAYMTRGRLPCSCRLTECRQLAIEVLGDIQDERAKRDAEWEWSADGTKKVPVRRDSQKRSA